MQSIYFPACFKKAWNNKFFSLPDLSKEAEERARGLCVWDYYLHTRGMSAQEALAGLCIVSGRSPAYWYRWRRRLREQGPSGLECASRRPRHCRSRAWDPAIMKRIAALRGHEETCRWGAKKLHLQLLKEGRCPPSVSTVARMIAYLMHTGVILRSQATCKRKKRALKHRRHAQRYKKALHEQRIRIQIDGDSYPGFVHFSALHISTRYAWARCYGRATARNAADFLQRVLGSMPEGMKYDAVQVDGGSEFMKEFEEHCRRNEIPLMVNHPHTPKQNAYVERIHRTFDEELYQVRNLPPTLSGINEELEDYTIFYNEHRFHAGINYSTPCEKAAEMGILTEQVRRA